ncbi:MAG: hypothetical protein QOI26_1022, partial [Pseudonocardiales bacterium]|nr:hypothetical protein [Pseudonocardiales bacterium]
LADEWKPAMSHEREPAAMLRDTMAGEARTVTASPAFTERVISAAQHSPAAEDGPPSGQPAWRGWLLPAAAAAVAAVLLAAVLVGAALLRPDHQPPAAPLPSLSTSVPTPGPSSSTSKSASPSPSPTTSTNPSGQVPIGGPVPAGFRAVDLTWVSVDEGWALGTAPCAKAPCTSIAHTLDGGKTWRGIPAPKAMLSQTDSCARACDLVTHLRFANPQVGYAFSANALFLTTDGGQSWAKQPGGSAYSLEIVDGMAVRVTGQAPSCAPGCAFSVQRAAIGTADWHAIGLPAGGQSAGAQLAASGKTVVLATFGHTSGGAENATSVLFASTDGGASWRKVGEPCPRGSGVVASGEVDTVAVAVAPDASITGLCAPRGGDGAKFTVTSTDGGAQFTAAPASLGAAAGDVLGAASARTLLVSLDQLFRSTDAGRHWQRVDAGGPAAASYIGFENSSVGRVLGVDGAGTPDSDSVWTTADAGRTWTRTGF